MLSESAYLIIVCLMIGVGIAVVSVAAAMAATIEFGFFGMAMPLLVGYAVGRLQSSQNRQALKSIQREEAPPLAPVTRQPNDRRKDLPAREKLVVITARVTPEQLKGLGVQWFP